MKVGFIGAGRMATPIGRHLIGAGHEVVLSSSRGPEVLAGVVADLGPAASAGSKQEATECDVVILAAMAPGARLVKSISNMPMAWIQDFSPQKPKSVLFVSGDDRDAKALMVELIDSTGLVALDLGSLADGGAMQQLGGPLSGVELHFVRRIVR